MPRRGRSLDTPPNPRPAEKPFLPLSLCQSKYSRNNLFPLTPEVCFSFVTYSLPLNAMLQLSTCLASVLSLSFSSGVLASGDAALHPHPGLAIPRGSKRAFHMQTQPSGCPDRKHRLYCALTLGPLSSRLIIPSTRQLWMASVPQRPPNYSNEPILHLLSLLPLPDALLPRKTTMRALAHVSPCSFHLQTNPGASPCDLARRCRLPLLQRMNDLLNGGHLLVWCLTMPE